MVRIFKYISFNQCGEMFKIIVNVTVFSPGVDFIDWFAPYAELFAPYAQL